MLSRTNAGFNLQSAPAVTGPLTKLPSATSPYTNVTTGAQQSLRLIGKPFANLEERIDKVVGRRNRTPDAFFKSGMQLQSLAVELHRSLKLRWAAKAVYRFKTHEEADEWMNRMLARSHEI